MAQKIFFTHKILNMKTKSLLFLLLFGFTHLNAQTYYKINFSGEPDSILVENLTKGTSLTLQGTDTLSLKLSGVGVQETDRSKRTLIIYPNPMDHSCRFDFENTTQGKVEILLFNANGKKLHDFNARLSAGMHQFELSGVPAGVYHLQIKTESYRLSGSFVSTYESSPDIALIHIKESPFRQTNGNADGNQKLSIDDVSLSFRSIVVMDFSTGDQLKFTGYKTNSDDDVEFASPTGDQTIAFTFCVRPAQPSAISGNDNPCVSTTLNYAVTHADGVTYTWTVPSDWTILSGQGSSNITVTAGSASGNISVTPSNTCGNGTSQSMAVTTQTAPATPTAGTHVSSQTQIVWNWNTVSGATGYKYNTVNNYATATDNGVFTTWTQTGLTCNTAYTLYVWAYNGCGNSSSLQLSQTTSACTSGCGDPVTFTYNGSTVTYGSVTSANNKCWLDRNLGATQVATSSADAASYGHLFQWGRLDDGHQVRTSLTTTTLSNSDVPGHNMFIKVLNSPNDWRSPQNNNLWQGEGGTNNPCPDGYRLPTQAEWDTERASWSTNNAAGAFASPLKLPMAGNRNYSNGWVYLEGSGGYYWSSTVYGISAWGLNFGSDNAAMSNDHRAGGFSVRCLKD